MKFRLLVNLELPESYQGRAPEDTVLWVLHSFNDFCARFVGSRSSVELLPDSTVIVSDVGPLEMRACPKCGNSWPVAAFAGDWCPICERKSARGRLRWISWFWETRPPYLVVFGWGAVGWLIAVWKVLKALAN